MKFLEIELNRGHKVGNGRLIKHWRRLGILTIFLYSSDYKYKVRAGEKIVRNYASYSYTATASHTVALLFSTKHKGKE